MKNKDKIIRLDNIITQAIQHLKFNAETKKSESLGELEKKMWQFLKNNNLDKFFKKMKSKNDIFDFHNSIDHMHRIYLVSIKMLKKKSKRIEFIERLLWDELRTLHFLTSPKGTIYELRQAMERELPNVNKMLDKEHSRTLTRLTRT